MLKKLLNFGRVIGEIKTPVTSNLEPYSSTLEEINNINLNSYSNSRLKAMSRELKGRAQKGESLDQLLVEAFALVREVSKRIVAMDPFDVQVIAGIALHHGKVVEMKTGEGKTLAAVMPAYLNALTGKGVHILTFNDYLSARDARWMGPIYEFLGLTIGYVSETMGTEERQRAYLRDITYVTAKESGFDYLRDFLCADKEELVQRPFHYAIVDEADSILIDEARIPLVIAGDISEDDDMFLNLSDLVQQLKSGKDYEIDQYERNISLTDHGLSRVETILNCGNLYDSKNLELLTRVNCALHGEVLLKKDRDYIVKNGKIEIIDEFTGRIADKRHWPDALQLAVEAKEGLNPYSKGKILGSIALQYFLALYPKISGMTGTARTAAGELRDFYGLEVVVIPTNKPCIRKDHPDLIFTHKEAKYKALLEEIKRVNGTGQPILIGTSSVEESEKLSRDLMKAGIGCEVLNAKNNALEAHIIARAGTLGAITVSTNMAGRGVDIKLGGEREQHKDQVSSLGGLYVIGTNRHESQRVDNQLRGRAGRQGDPGESRFFISLEDNLLRRYDIPKLIPDKHYPQRQELPLDNRIVRREVERGQRIVQGYHSDLRKQLWKYTFIIEEQRRIIHEKRQEILMGQTTLNLLSTKAKERYDALLCQVGREILEKAEKQLTLYNLNKCWADYLDYMAYVREGIHLVAVSRENPLDAFHKIAIKAFDEVLERIEREIINTFKTIEINEDGIDLEKEGLKGPSSTWTYLVKDDPGDFSHYTFILKVLTPVFKGTLFTIRSIYQGILKRLKMY